MLFRCAFPLSLPLTLTLTQGGLPVDFKAEELQNRGAELLDLPGRVRVKVSSGVGK